VAAQLLLLLPPSEAKTSGGTTSGSPGAFDDALEAARRQVMEALVRTLEESPLKRRETLLNARGPLFDRALEATKLLASGHARLRPAWKRFSGVVWSHLDPASLTPGVRRRIIVPSGAYGLTTGEDRIAEFRLKMNVGVGSLGTMATFWRPLITPLLALHVRTAPIVSLLPKEHEAALDFAMLEKSRTVVRVAFSDEGGSATVGHDAKAVKGILARTLLQQGVTSLATFEWQGWRAVQRNGITEIVAP
jgi:cytoplasmic iron level regulating protein YaaA (DUF328/UPF0246 family)